MEATFFVSHRDAAVGVRSWGDIPAEPVAESLLLPTPEALKVLASLLVDGAGASLQPLRDATCQSFPVWEFGTNLTAQLIQMSDAELERVAEDWRRGCEPMGLESDLCELSDFLNELRTSLRDTEGSGQCLFVLLEEKAM